MLIASKQRRKAAAAVSETTSVTVGFEDFRDTFIERLHRTDSVMEPIAYSYLIFVSEVLAHLLLRLFYLGEHVVGSIQVGPAEQNASVNLQNKG